MAAVDDQLYYGLGSVTWLKETDELIGSRHDVNFTVTGTQDGITVHRRDDSNSEAENRH